MPRQTQKSDSDYEDRKAQLMDEIRQQASLELGLNKATSNLFRDRRESAKQRLNVRAFHHVLEVNSREKWADVEGMTTFAEFVDGTLPAGMMPAVVPQLRTITVGGATTGLGIEATSFKEGLVHDAIAGMDILLPDGRVVWATRDNAYQDLFRGFPNSYGTLGYALKLRMNLLPVKQYVEVTHLRYEGPQHFFEDLARLAQDYTIDFLDGVVFASNELYLSVGRFVEETPWVSDYTFEHIYYQSIRRKQKDYLTTHDYLWRWDTDWFWASKNVGAQNWLLRRLVYGRRRLNSATYTKLMRWNARNGLLTKVNRWLGIRTESVIQDVDIPIDRCPEFLKFLFEEIGIQPIWACPIRPIPKGEQAPLYEMKPNTLHVNFGFWDTLRRHDSHPSENFLNRKVEKKVAELGGMKSLYSSAYYGEEEFSKLYNGKAYRKLKRKYDPEGRMGEVYAKVVKRR